MSRKFIIGFRQGDPYRRYFKSLCTSEKNTKKSENSIYDARIKYSLLLASAVCTAITAKQYAIHSHKDGYNDMRTIKRDVSDVIATRLNVRPVPIGDETSNFRPTLGGNYIAASGGILNASAHSISEKMNHIDFLAMSNATVGTLNLLKEPTLCNFRRMGTTVIMQCIVGLWGALNMHKKAESLLEDVKAYGCFNLLYRYWYRNYFINHEQSTPLVHYVLKRSAVNDYFAYDTPPVKRDAYNHGARIMRSSNKYMEDVIRVTSAGEATLRATLIAQICVVFLYVTGNMRNAETLLRIQYATVATIGVTYGATIGILHEVSTSVKKSAEKLIASNSSHNAESSKNIVEECMTMLRDASFCNDNTSCSVHDDVNDVDLWKLYSSYLKTKARAKAGKQVAARADSGSSSAKEHLPSLNAEDAVKEKE
jgi:hypothetical protein